MKSLLFFMALGLALLFMLAALVVRSWIENAAKGWYEQRCVPRKKWSPIKPWYVRRYDKWEATRPRGGW
jgi:hypothetical protein